jgi:hypothetical protein
MPTPLVATGSIVTGSVSDNGPEILLLVTALEALNTQATAMELLIKGVSASIGIIETNLGRSVRGNLVPGPNFGAAVGVKSSNDAYTYSVNAAVLQRRNQLSSPEDQFPIPPAQPGEVGL